MIFFSIHSSTSTLIPIQSAFSILMDATTAQLFNGSFELVFPAKTAADANPRSAFVPPNVIHPIVNIEGFDKAIDASLEFSITRVELFFPRPLAANFDYVFAIVPTTVAATSDFRSAIRAPGAVAGDFRTGTTNNSGTRLVLNWPNGIDRNVKGSNPRLHAPAILFRAKPHGDAWNPTTVEVVVTLHVSTGTQLGYIHNF
jgi:hypothetical protein